MTDITQIFLMGLLVVVTCIYVWLTHAISKATKEQAGASVKMAEEMREQRRPIVVAEVVPFEINTPKTQSTDHTRGDIFEVRNVGIGPAIELQIILLDEEKTHPQIQRETIFSNGDAPIEFYPLDLERRENTTCYLVCRYRSVLSPNVRQIWYETWLPFEPIKSQSGDKIIIKPGELEFREDFEKKSF